MLLKTIHCSISEKSRLRHPDASSSAIHLFRSFDKVSMGSRIYDNIFQQNKYLWTHRFVLPQKAHSFYLYDGEISSAYQQHFRIHYKLVDVHCTNYCRTFLFHYLWRIFSGIGEYYQSLNVCLSVYSLILDARFCPHLFSFWNNLRLSYCMRFIKIRSKVSEVLHHGLIAK